MAEPNGSAGPGLQFHARLAGGAESAGTRLVENADHFRADMSSNTHAA